MLEQEELLEIQGLGEELPGPAVRPPERAGLPLWQAVFCLLLLLGLVGLKLAREDLFLRVRDWYRAESVQEIELPSLTRPTPQPEETSPPEETPLPESALGELRQV